MATEKVKERLEYLRGELRKECISQGELVELQGLARHIDPDDVELLEAAGVPEFPSWGSVRGGKWHITINDEPSFTREEESRCGLKFTPLNVTHGEAPPTAIKNLCRKCIESAPGGLMRQSMR